MTDRLSGLFSSSNSSGGGNVVTQAYNINMSELDALRLTKIHPAGAPPESPPVYSFTGSESTTPNTVLYWGMPTPHGIIGEGTFSTFSSKVDMRLRNMPMNMKKSQMSESFSLESPVTGRLKWKTSEMSGSTLYLKDEQGTRIARMKSSLHNKVLEIHVPCNPMFAEAVLFSALTVKSIKKDDAKTAVDVMSSVLG